MTGEEARAKVDRMKDDLDYRSRLLANIAMEMAPMEDGDGEAARYAGAISMLAGALGVVASNNADPRRVLGRVTEMLSELGNRVAHAAFGQESDQ